MPWYVSKDVQSILRVATRLTAACVTGDGDEEASCKHFSLSFPEYFCAV